ncbi:hypothetical protein DMENIID0001_169040 [Sergentomyia squamirostris]
MEHSKLASNTSGIEQPEQPVIHQPTSSHEDLDVIPESEVLLTYPSLGILTHLDQLQLFQKVRLGFGRNKFTISTAAGEGILWTREGSDGVTTGCYGNDRPFDVFISDSEQKDIIHINRPYECLCCSEFVLEEVLVHSPLGVLIGHVEQQGTVLGTKFTIKDVSGKPLLNISGPTFTAAFGGDVPFMLKKLNGDEVGAIVKKWSGAVQEMFTDADNYWVTFPVEFDVRIKALILGACFLIEGETSFLQDKKNEMIKRPSIFDMVFPSGTKEFEGAGKRSVRHSGDFCLCLLKKLLENPYVFGSQQKLMGRPDGESAFQVGDGTGGGRKG